MAGSSSSTTVSSPHNTDIQIPPQLKFLMSNLKNMIQTTLAADNYLTWKSQLVKIFSANGFLGHLDGSNPKPEPFLADDNGDNNPNPLLPSWTLINQNLASTLYATISPSLLPYVLNLDTCSEIWLTLAKRLQATNRARLIQLKSDLHHMSMGTQTMNQYLSKIKSIVDQITASGSNLDVEDIILYTLNGLPSSYHAFKTSIRTNLQPLSLDDLYTLLCSEETLQSTEQNREIQSSSISDPTVALAAHTNRGRGRPHFLPCGRTSSYRGRGRNTNRSTTVCQIWATWHSPVGTAWILSTVPHLIPPQHSQIPHLWPCTPAALPPPMTGS